MRQRENPSSHQNDRRKRLNSSEFDWDTGNGAYASNARTSDRQNPYREDQIRQTQSRQNTNRQNPNRQAPDRQAQSRQAQSRQAQSRQAQSRQAQSRQAKSGYAQSEYAQNRYAQSGQSDERRVQSRQSQPERNPYDDYQRKSKGQKKNKHTIGKIIALIQAALSLIVLGVLFVLDVLPMMYIGVLAALLVFLWLFAFFSQYTKKSHIPGKIFSLIMCALLALAGYYLLVTKNMLSQITNYAYNVDNMVVAVRQDDPAQSLQDAADYAFGARLAYDGQIAREAIDKINNTVGKEIYTVEYDSLTEQIDALYNGQVNAIIYNENMLGSIEEVYPNFSTETRILDNVSIKTKAETEEVSKVSVTKESFIVYISGNDGYGQLSIKGRSDVNMMVAVNPKTKQILMINTPRDFYVEFPGVTNGVKDKLTHAGNYGIECSMETLESIYGCDIDYYVRVNFSSLINMVDALGGVTVYSDLEFTALDGRHFVQGANELDGESALMFARERKAFADGDFQRGRDQQLLLTAMIQKAMSPAILTGYTGIMSSVQNNFATNMPESSITSLVKKQLSDGGDWNIVTAAATGTPSMEYCYSSGGNLSVVVPDQASVDQCRIMLDKLFNDEILSSADTAQ